MGLRLHPALHRPRSHQRWRTGCGRWDRDTAGGSCCHVPDIL